ncbi:OLC1v1026310C8 [Oldenlandia corymbosa var. corymbosa]|uniref:OLC1v1026310C8 n=1 Tax=Oldenlandia corymbosa var. corymbosa TaxID=529605 RepID=A0AAV1C7D5_OLDCO|nr:OLC1v1026310C8 [Oldenlandia corymbosa var. corymbosa]
MLQNRSHHLFWLNIHSCVRKGFELGSSFTFCTEHWRVRASSSFPTSTSNSTLSTMIRFFVHPSFYFQGVFAMPQAQMQGNRSTLMLFVLPQHWR